jgi:hypothetical protein
MLGRGEYGKVIFKNLTHLLGFIDGISPAKKIISTQ